MIDNNKNAVEIFNKLATLYQQKFMDVSMYHATFDLFCNLIQNENAELLELACGPGNITRYLLKIKPLFKILGTDLAPNMIQLAKENNPSAQFKLMDCRGIALLDKKYDALMCGFCLPYLTKEEAVQLIKDAASILHANAVIYISTMEDDYSKSGYKTGSSGDTMFMHYHEAGYLTEALISNQFTIKHLERICYPANDQSGSTITDLIIIAQLNNNIAD